MGGGATESDRPMLGPYRQIILFGDSITEQSGNQQYLDQAGNPYFGFAFLPAVQNWFIRRFDVLNRGFSGYNTAAARIILPQFMPKPEQATVSLITIFFGANDSATKLDGPENQHVSLTEYKSNLKAIIHDSSVQDHKPRVLLIAPAPIDEYNLEKTFAPGLRKASVTKQYAEACCQVAQEENVAVLDLWTEMMKSINWDLTQPGIPGSKDLPEHPVLAAHFTDGLHFSAQGYAFFYGAFIAKLKATWPEMEEMNADGYDTVFPLWRAAMDALQQGTHISPRSDRASL